MAISVAAITIIFVALYYKIKKKYDLDKENKNEEIGDPYPPTPYNNIEENGFAYVDLADTSSVGNIRERIQRTHPISTYNSLYPYD